VGTSLGLTETITEVADLPALDWGLGLRNLSERIWTFFELKTESARLGKSSSALVGRNTIGREWIASWSSLGARRQGRQGEFPTGKERLSGVVSASKYSAKAAARVVGSETWRVTEPLSLTLAVTERGRVQLASLRTRAAMLGKVAAMRRESGCSVGGDIGA